MIWVISEILKIKKKTSPKSIVKSLLKEIFHASNISKDKTNDRNKKNSTQKHFALTAPS